MPNCTIFFILNFILFFLLPDSFVCLHYSFIFPYVVRNNINYSISVLLCKVKAEVAPLVHLSTLSTRLRGMLKSSPPPFLNSVIGVSKHTL